MGVTEPLDHPQAPVSAERAPQRKRRKVTRSKAGCLSCRRRRKRCDMEKPDCLACQRLHLKCTWPTASSHDINGTSVQRNESVESDDKDEIDSAVDGLMGLISTPPVTRADDLVPPSTSSAFMSDSLVPEATPSQNVIDWNEFTSLNEEMLQLWAADCLPSFVTTQPANPFDPLSDLLNNPVPVPATPLITSLASATDTNEMLKYYREKLSNLVSCGEDPGVPNAFHAFTSLANASMSTLAGQGLHFSILAWAGRHMVNKGQERYEVPSERLATQASLIVLERCSALQEDEAITLFAALLMLIQHKICRGDVWGFDIYLDRLSKFVPLLYPSEGKTLSEGHFHFFENLVYHDIVSSSLFIRGPIVPQTVLSTYTRSSIDAPQTLTGLSLEAFCIMHRVAELVRQRRQQKTWEDDVLADIMQATHEIERDLEAEKRRLNESIKAKPNLASHRYFHEAFRISCLLQLTCCVVGHPPSCLNVRFLVRRSLSLLEAMADQELPGLCSSHWIMFTTGICAAESDPGNINDRARALRLYDRMQRDFSFNNCERSRKLMQEVWVRNKGGKVMVDWLDILQEFDWDIIFA